MGAAALGQRPVGRAYDFNLLVSCSWYGHMRAKGEIQSLLARLGDARASVRRTLARGILGVRTSLDAREVIARLQALHAANPLAFQHTCTWVPIDLWTTSEIDAMKEAVLRLRPRIGPDHRWRMTVEKRRYTRHHTIEIIRALADLVPGKVDLEHPDRILRVDILGSHAGLSVLTPAQIFSTGLRG
jgi:tRNA(Ser,Leu) C12 N-acetylase TAN1